MAYKSAYADRLDELRFTPRSQADSPFSPLSPLSAFPSPVRSGGSFIPPFQPQTTAADIRAHLPRRFTTTDASKLAWPGLLPQQPQPGVLPELSLDLMSSVSVNHMCEHPSGECIINEPSINSSLIIRPANPFLTLPCHFLSPSRH